MKKGFCFFFALAQRGITAGVEGVALTDEEHLAFTLTLARAGAGPLRLPMDASLRYLITETGAVRNFTAIWGGVSLADRDTVAVCDLKTIALYDADTLEKLDFTPDLSRHAGGECDLVGVVRDPALGVVALYADEANDGFLCFDENGKQTAQYTVDYGDSSDRLFRRASGGSTIGPEVARYWSDTEVLHLDTTLIAYRIDRGTGNETTHYYELETGDSYQSFAPLIRCADGRHTAELRRIRRDNTSFAPETARNCLALRYTDGALSEWFYADGRNINEAFGFKAGEDPYPRMPSGNVACAADDGAMRITARCGSRRAAITPS